MKAAGTSDHGEELWAGVLATAVDAIVLIDEAGIILQANMATSSVLGYEPSQLAGRNVSELMPEPYRSMHDEYIGRYLTTHDARIIGIGREVEALHADGHLVPVELAVSETETPMGRLFTGVLHDLTERKRIEQMLRHANDTLEHRVKQRTAELEASMAELARSNRDLEQFAYIASHDLQGPLRNVRQGLELLDEHLRETVGDVFDEEADTLRHYVLDGVERMDELIKGLLSYSRVERTGSSVDARVDLAELVHDVVDEHKYRLADDVTFTVGDLPHVSGDRVQLRQLISNLVQNAIKYRSTNRPLKVSVWAAAEGNKWKIHLADNGIGVPPDQQTRVFDLFRRGHVGYSGTGLGLAICQRIVERHGGSIGVNSDGESGSEFSFTLRGARS
ncbi:MAG: PAS domain S-box protein [Actinomycetia bacterium]|nr:PAS domain S-box protein [Actinomycetes bacterium]MCP4960750.1 PAS domain S-box protein [Actinomycetes bacterium]